jgi:integrase
MQVSDLTLAALQRWRDSLVGEPPAGLDDIARRAHRRAAQATTNRKWASVRAALNHAFNTGRVDSDLAWRRIKPFRAADAPRKRFLSVAECNKLLGASPPAFRNFVQAALLTGLRPGELTRLNVAAFEGTRLAVSAGKTGEGRHVSLTSDGQVFFKKLVKGRSQGAVMLINTAGERWTRQQWKRATKAAVEAAGLATSAVFYDLRRSYGSLLANAGAQDTVIAHSLGHADTRMVRKHYGHLLDETVARELEDKLPTFRATRPKHAKTAV